MEGLTISFDPQKFDNVVHSTVPEYGDLQAIAKWQRAEPDRGIKDKLLVVLTFTVQVDNKPLRVQAVTFASLIHTLNSALLGWEQLGPGGMN